VFGKKKWTVHKLVKFGEGEPLENWCSYIKHCYENTTKLPI